MENYEKKYKAALNWMRSIYPTMQGTDRENAEHHFPELKESEDEKIRKGLIRGLSAMKNIHNRQTFSDDAINIDDAIAWLEKQGKQKPADKVEPKFKIGDRVIGVVSGMPYFITKICDDHYNTESGCIIMFCAQDNFELYEQKPSWSEEDEKMLEDTISCLSAYQSPDISKGLCYQEQIDWLKSIEPQLHWKPSEEQMQALKYEIESTSENSWQRKECEKLYNDLQNL